jgi:hypothetical protein
MIFQHYRNHLLVVRQPDHGVQTGLFAQHWGNERTPPFTPREPVIAAGTRHDDGWKAWEDTPRWIPRLVSPGSSTSSPPTNTCHSTARASPWPPSMT